VSRSLPAAASDRENRLIAKTRRYLSVFQQNSMMIRAGLYSPGSDPELDAAQKVWPDLDAYLAMVEKQDIRNSFARLELIFRRNGVFDQAESPAPQKRPNSAA
jgi:flagellum-specific ATP synthase